MNEGKEKPFFTQANEHSLKDRGGVRFMWQTIPVKWDGEYTNIYAALYAHGDLNNAIPLDNFPLYVLKDLLILSDMQLIALLNEPSHSKRHIVTLLEDEFKEYENNLEPWDDITFFTLTDAIGSDFFAREHDGIYYGLRGDHYRYSVHLLDFEKWAENNPDMLPENRYKTTKGDPAALHARISELEGELAKRDQTIADLEKAAQDGAQGADDDIESLQAKLEQYEKDNTGINAEQWQACITAALKLNAQIMKAGETGIKKADSLKCLHDQTEKGWTLATIDRIAWQQLPEEHKHGRGAPKKNTQ